MGVICSKSSSGGEKHALFLESDIFNQQLSSTLPQSLGSGTPNDII